MPNKSFIIVYKEKNETGETSFHPSLAVLCCLCKRIMFIETVPCLPADSPSNLEQLTFTIPTKKQLNVVIYLREIDSSLREISDFFFLLISSISFLFQIATETSRRVCAGILGEVIERIRKGLRFWVGIVSIVRSQRKMGMTESLFSQPGVVYTQKPWAHTHNNNTAVG